jgi:hypothetical protein
LTLIDRYEGDWKDDVKWGRGTYFHASVGEGVEGRWENDEKVE